MLTRTKSLFLTITFPVLLLAAIFVLSTNVADAAPFWTGWGYAIEADFNGTEPIAFLHVAVEDITGASHNHQVQLDCMVDGKETYINGGLHSTGEGYVLCEVPPLYEVIVEFTANLGDKWDTVEVGQSFGSRPFYAQSTVFTEQNERWFSLIQGLDGDVNFQLFDAPGANDQMVFAMDSIQLERSNTFDLVEYGTVGVAIDNTPCDNGIMCDYYYLLNGVTISPPGQVAGTFVPSNWEDYGTIIFGEGLDGTMLDAMWDPFCSASSPVCN